MSNPRGAAADPDPEPWPERRRSSGTDFRRTRTAPPAADLSFRHPYEVRGAPRRLADRTVERRFRRYRRYAGFAFWLVLTRSWVAEDGTGARASAPV